MSTSLDPIAVAKMPEDQRRQVISSVLQMLFQMKEQDALNALTSVLRTLAEKATDEEYINWCKTTMSIIATFPDNVVKAALTLRSKAVSQLPKDLANRDSQIVSRVMSMLDKATSDKLMRNM